MEPALTTEEWAEALAGERPDLYRDGGHATAALYLYGQPFGFTWKMVDLLREIAEVQDYNKEDPVSAEGLLSIADRIAALLPPRDPAEKGLKP